MKEYGGDLPMKKIVEIMEGPAIPEMGGVKRVVVFEDGWGQVQSYIPQKRMWVKGGSSLQSLTTAEDATPEKLKQLGYDEEDILNIFWQPGDQ